MKLDVCLSKALALGAPISSLSQTHRATRWSADPPLDGAARLDPRHRYTAAVQQPVEFGACV